jgi:NitT/TauT family transport system ATP-binding protein
MKTCLDILHLKKQYQKKKSTDIVSVFDNIDLTIQPDEFVSIVGPSGCGKTTLLRIIAGLDEASDGVVNLDGKPINGQDKRIGLVFQQFALFPWRTTIQNIEMGLEMNGVAKTVREEAAMEYIKAFDLEGFEHAYPNTLSGGMKQRVAIARTLIMNPEVVLMDEPFASLDSQTRNDMQNFLYNLRKKRNETVLFVTHNVDEAVYLSNRIIVLSRRPARIVSVFKVNLPEDRDRTSPEVNQIRKEILQLLDRYR